MRKLVNVCAESNLLGILLSITILYLGQSLRSKSKTIVFSKLYVMRLKIFTTNCRIRHLTQPSVGVQNPDLILQLFSLTRVNLYSRVKFPTLRIDSENNQVKIASLLWKRIGVLKFDRRLNQVVNTALNAPNDSILQSIHNNS